MTTNERRLRKFINKWVPKLGLESWDLTVEVVPQETVGGRNGFDYAADCLAHWEYERATIRFAEPFEDDKQLEAHVIHELQHVLLNELRREHRMQNEERTATLLTRAFLRVAA